MKIYKMHKPKIGITVGDLNGIGLEVALKTLADQRISKYCQPIIYGSAKVVSYHKNIVESSLLELDGELNLKERLQIVNCWHENVSIHLGHLSQDAGKYARLSLERAIDDLKNGRLDAIVTLPIHKKAMQLAGFGHVGHTEYLREQWPDHPTLMMMVSKELRLGLVTTHLPLSEVSKSLSKDLIIQKINLLSQSLKVDFGIEKPSIAVLGLNPHASDDGLIGQEEELIIRPAIIESKKSGNLVFGPFPADGFFGSGAYKKYDAVLAMYHDQGLIPFKTLSFESGVNFTAGLPIVRTSPDHGTAFDIAGKNQANPTSFRASLFLAIDICRNRKDYFDTVSNAVQRVQLESEAEDAPMEKIEDL